MKEKNISCDNLEPTRFQLPAVRSDECELYFSLLYYRNSDRQYRVRTSAHLSGFQGTCVTEAQLDVTYYSELYNTPLRFLSASW